MNCRNGTAPSEFRATVSAARSVVAVEICADQGADDENFKVVSGDILVRPTVGFNVGATHCARYERTTSLSASQSDATTTTQDNAALEETSNEETSDQSWLAPTIVACVLFVVLVLALALLFKARRQQQHRPQTRVASTVDTNGVYGKSGFANLT
jgi:hypothetical protein